MTKILFLGALLLGGAVFLGCARPPESPPAGAEEKIVLATPATPVTLPSRQAETAPSPEQGKAATPQAPSVKPAKATSATPPPASKPVPPPLGAGKPAGPAKSPGSHPSEPISPAKKSAALPPVPRGGEKAQQVLAGNPKKTPLATAAEEADAAPLIVCGEVLVVSHIPEPGTVPYTECLTFIKYKVLSVEKGDYPDSEILAVHWGMKENRLTPAARYKVGETYRLRLEPFDDHPELARVMQADDTNEYTLTPYWGR